MTHILLTAVVAGGAGLVGFVAGWLLKPRRKPSAEASASGDPFGFAPELSHRGSLPESPKSERSAQEPQLDQFMLGVVDAIDEIELMKSDFTAEASRGLALVQGRLEDSIALADGELIRETVWQPALQRAVKVEPAAHGQTEVHVLRARATGLKHQGRLIRKQEVVISQP